MYTIWSFELITCCVFFLSSLLHHLCYQTFFFYFLISLCTQCLHLSFDTWPRNVAITLFCSFYFGVVPYNIFWCLGPQLSRTFNNNGIFQIFNTLGFHQELKFKMSMIKSKYHLQCIKYFWFRKWANYLKGKKVWVV